MTTTLVYDVAAGLPVLLDDGTRTYVWGAQGLAYAVEQSSGAISVYHTDGLGSVRALTDSSGNVVQTYGTDEFGVPDAGLTQGSVTQPFGRSGEQQLGGGLVDLRARLYDPSLGRFVQRDAFAGLLASPLSLNRFSYALSNPIGLVDPSGLSPSQSRVLDDNQIRIDILSHRMCIAPRPILLPGGSLGASVGPVKNLDPLGRRDSGSPRAAPSIVQRSDDVLSKPVVSNQKLQNIVDDLYKGTTNPNRVGTGTTADAIRHELTAGLSTSGRFHLEKGRQHSRALSKLLDDPSLDFRDRLVAQSLLDDLQAALGGR